MIEDNGFVTGAAMRKLSKLLFGFHKSRFAAGRSRLMKLLKTVALAACCVVFLCGNIEKGATVKNARYACTFSSEANAAAQAQGSEGKVLVSDSYLLSRGVNVRPQTATNSTPQDESKDSVAGVPVSAAYLKSRGFDHVDRTVVQNSYIWKDCTIWYEDETPGADSHLSKQSSVQDGKFTFADLVIEFEKCQIEDSVALVSVVGSGEDNVTIHDLNCFHSPLKELETSYTAASENNDRESNKGANGDGQDSTIESTDFVEDQVPAL